MAPRFRDPCQTKVRRNNPSRQSLCAGILVLDFSSSRLAYLYHLANCTKLYRYEQKAVPRVLDGLADQSTKRVRRIITKKKKSPRSPYLVYNVLLHNVRRFSPINQPYFNVRNGMFGACQDKQDEFNQTKLTNGLQISVADDNANT